MGSRDEIKSITFRSPDLANPQIAEDYFDVDFKNLVLKKPYDLDVVKIDFMQLLFTCTSMLSSYSDTFLLYVTIDDINNYTPEFVNAPYEFKMKEVSF